MRTFTPRPYQTLALEFMLQQPRCALWAGMGTGKTVTTYNVLDTRYMLGFTTKPTLVLGPMRVARDVWTEEAGRWAHLSHIRVASVVGSEKQRIKALSQDASVYCTNYEQLPWLVARFKNKWPFGTVVCDEATRLKSFRLRQGGQRAHALAQVAHSCVDFWINLTGTPSPNGLKDLWGQTWFLDRGQRLGLTFSAFVERWFKVGYDGFGLTPLAHASAEIHERLKDICMSINAADWFDLKQPVVRTVKVKLPAAAMKIYQEFERSMFAELACGSELEVFNAAALTNKCLQIANGAVYHGKEGWKPVHDAKLEALESVVNESGGTPVLVAYNFVSDKERLLKAFPGAVLLSDASGMKKFRAGDAQIGLAHPKSMGHGIDGLQHVTNILVRFGHDWNLEERMQMLERIGPARQAQAGLDRPVLVYDLVAEDTIDETVLARHETKREVQDLLLAAMKHGGIKVNL